MKDVLKALNRGSNLSDDASDVKRLLDHISRGRLLSASVTTGRGPYALITSTSDEAYAVDIGVVSMSQSAQQAEAIAESTKAGLEKLHIEWLSIESKTFENFAVVEGTMDEKYLEWWEAPGFSFYPAYYSEGELVEAYEIFVQAPAPAPSAPGGAQATATPVPMCPSRSQSSAPAPRADVATRSVSVPDDPLDLVPDTATNVEVYDTEAILTDDDVPSVFRDSFVGHYNDRLLSPYLGEGNFIPTDEVTKVVRWQGSERSESFLIVSGGFDRNGIKDKLREQAYEQSEYRGFELWSYRYTVAFLGTEHILIDLGTHFEVVEDLLAKLSRGAGMLTQSDDSTIKRMMDKAGQGLTLVAGQNCVAPGCSAYAIATSASSEDYAMSIKYVGLFGSGPDAEAGVADMENYINRTYDVVRLDSRIDGEFAIVDAVVDEESVMFR